MTTTGWLPLAEYSIKHQVSISTLRRRIKADDIKFRFQDGKYFLYDGQQPKVAPPAEHRPSLKNEISVNGHIMHSGAAPKTNTATAPIMMAAPPAKATAHAGATSALEPGESVISAANKLLMDLKKAYTQVLQEKESQILSLNEEIVDLKTLIKVLESENSRLRERQ